MFSGDQRSGGVVRGARFGLLNVRVFHLVSYFYTIILSSVVLAEISVGRLRRHDLRRRGPSAKHPRQHLAWVVMFRGEEEVKGDGDDEAGPRKAHRCAVP